MTLAPKKLVFASRPEGTTVEDRIRERVDAYFSKNKISTKANGLMVAKILFYLGGCTSLYFLILVGGFGDLALFGLTLLLGFFSGAIGINIGHDACHGACSSKPWVNKITSFSFELIGASTYTWKIAHNIIHHTYAKIVGWDRDMESMPWLRFYVKPGRRWFHRYQHLYATLLYGLITLVWVFKKDFSQIFEKEIRSHVKGGKVPLIAYMELFGFKVLHFGLFLVIPIIVLGIPIWKGALGFFCMHYIAGLTLTLVFQIGHCVEETHTIQPSASSNVIADTWTEHQFKTSANFGEQSFLTDWICGGLNYQIEHHLFPKICHTHYPAIAKIVRQAADEFGLPYHSFKNFREGYVSHLRLLKYAGRTDPV
jgi:linoleoyl-CoA desaturase